jgi:hypothetical protein
MRITSAVVPLTTAAGLVAALTVATGVSGASPTVNHFVGYAGGTLVRALGNTVESGLTSESGVDTTRTGVRSANTLATATTPKLLSVGAVSTDTATKAISGGVQLTAHARVTNVNLLGGAITIKAVDTVNTARIVNGRPSSDIHTTFAGIHIAGTKLPVTIPKNFNVTIPGVAQVVLNQAYPVASGDRIMTLGTGLYLSLLTSRGSSPAGTQVYLNPTYSAIAPTVPVTAADIGGYAYGTSVFAKAGKVLNAKSGPTAQKSMPSGGTGGIDRSNKTAGVNLAPIATAAVVASTANGVKDKGTASYSTMTTRLAKLNLFDGLIRADALTGTASVKELPDGSTKASTSASLVNLVIAGRRIPVNVSPNTVITVADLGRITIRGEARSANQALVTVLDVKLTTARYGLPVGAEVKVGVAAAWVVPPR